MTDHQPQKVAYLAGRIRATQDELKALESAYQAALDEWAIELSAFKPDERVVVRGVPGWPAKVTRVRANRAQELDEEPMVMVEVRYVRRDGQFGLRGATFSAIHPNGPYLCVYNSDRLERAEQSESP